MADILDSGASVGHLRSKSVEHFRDLAGIAHDWCRGQAGKYTDPVTGEPLPLTESVLLGLISNRVRHRGVPQVLQRLIREGMVERRADGLHQLLVERQVILGTREAEQLAMERTAALVWQFVNLTMRNARTSDLQARDVDRGAMVYFLPEKFVPLYRKIARERAIAFIDGIDNWLEDHSDPNFEGPVVEASFQVHSFVSMPRENRAPVDTEEGRSEESED